MKLTRRQLVASGAALAAPSVMGTANAQATTTLRLHHFLPPVSNMHVKMLVPWAKKVEAASGGKLVIQIFPSMQLGGTPPQLYDQARDGVVDIVWTLPGSTPGRFPASETFELPFICNRKGSVNARAAQEFGNSFLGEETKDVKLLSYWAHDHGVIHSNKPIATMDDLKGMKLRFPTRLAGEALKALGVSAIGMPVSQVPESLAQGVIDGAVTPWEVVPAIKVHELLKNHTEIPGSPTFYTATFFLAMNKAKFASLPPEFQKIIDDTTGLVFAADAGKMWDEAGAAVEEMVRKRGNSIKAISEAERDKWIATTQPVTDAWIKSMADKGLDGNKMIAAAKAALGKYASA